MKSSLEMIKMQSYQVSSALNKRRVSMVTESCGNSQSLIKLPPSCLLAAGLILWSVNQFGIWHTCDVPQSQAVHRAPVKARQWRSSPCCQLHSVLYALRASSVCVVCVNVCVLVINKHDYCPTLYSLDPSTLLTTLADISTLVTPSSCLNVTH